MKRWGKQEFLNDPWSPDSGAITAFIQVVRGTNRTTVSSEVSVWDCSRKVDLDFNAGPDNLAERRKKIDRFEKVTQMFVQKYRDALDQIEKDRG